MYTIKLALHDFEGFSLRSAINVEWSYIETPPLPDTYPAGGRGDTSWGLRIYRDASLPGAYDWVRVGPSYDEAATAHTAWIMNDAGATVAKVSCGDIPPGWLRRGAGNGISKAHLDKQAAPETAEAA